MVIRLVPLAERELDEAIAWYDARKECFGSEFFREFMGITNEISQFPLMYPERRPRIRCGTVKRFPYSVWYAIRPEEILVVAISAWKRAPDYWIGREI